MKIKTQIFILALLAALPVAADELTLRYNLSGLTQLNMEHNIYVPNRDSPLATRNFSMTFDLGSTRNRDELIVTLSAVQVSYKAQGMNQLLPTSHLTGIKFNLLGDGHSYRAPDHGLEVPFGPATDSGVRPSEILAGMLPTLPRGPVSVGTKWNTSRNIVSLVGWAWASGNMQHHHEIIDIQPSVGRTVVTVKTHGETAISSAKGHVGFLNEGRLSQRIEWRFDAESGRLLSLSTVQEAWGINLLPQGEIPIRQVTHYALLAYG
jgi:hypothetical protein